MTEREEGRQSPNGDLLAAAPGLVRLAATAYLHTLGWTLSVTVKTANGALKLVLTGEGADALVDGLGSRIQEQLKRLLGVTEIESRLGRMPEPPQSGAGGNGKPADHATQLKERGAELLARSAEVDDDGLSHPAYDRILTSLAPDEARILRLMAIEGARAAVDVRTWRPLDVGSELVAQGLSMIGAQAGCRHLDRIPAYLNNLERLGLVWFSREEVSDLSAYQVLEAQPVVAEAMEKAGRGKTVRRSVQMTPFGRDFCEVCLPLDTAGFLAIQDSVNKGRRDLSGR